ncbi:MAG: helix-hairpin-helix domain-containing protein [Patescibacteria group bacterium]
MFYDFNSTKRYIIYFAIGLLVLLLILTRTVFSVESSPLRKLFNSFFKLQSPSVLSKDPLLSNQLKNTQPMEEIFVEISGAVKSPGVYKLLPGARLNDLLLMANGFAKNADTLWVSKHLNKAEKVYDGMKVYVPNISENFSVTLTPGVPNTQASAANTVFTGNGEVSKPGLVLSDISKTNVNKAGAAELDVLPGVGSSYAQKIIKSRPYKDFEDFKKRSGIPFKTANSLKNQLSF